MTNLQVLLPAEPGVDASKMQKMIWGEEVKEYVKYISAAKGNTTALYAIIWGQCSESMQAQLMSKEEQ